MKRRASIPGCVAALVACAVAAQACATGTSEPVASEEGPGAAAVVTPSAPDASAASSIDLAAPKTSDAGSEGGTRKPDAAVDARSDAPVTLPGCVCTQGCGSCPNVVDVPVKNFRIDGTEVTNVQYGVFLSTLPTTEHLPAACASNEFAPALDWPVPSGREHEPVTHVDWCDAFAYCRWAGKRLCGGISGGANALAKLDDPDASQWFAACSNGGSRSYPYGSGYTATSCNGADRGLGLAAAVGQGAACVGGFASLFDMSGNVWEWEDSCSGDAPHDACRIRGGSFSDGPNQLACASDATLPRDAWGPNVGFRCCSR